MNAYKSSFDSYDCLGRLCSKCEELAIGGQELVCSLVVRKFQFDPLFFTRQTGILVIVEMLRLAFHAAVAGDFASITRSERLLPDVRLARAIMAGLECHPLQHSDRR